jgi:hypothetical protein
VLQSEKWIPTKRSPINSYASKARAKAKQKGEEVRGEVTIKTAQASLNYNIYQRLHLIASLYMTIEILSSWDQDLLKFLGLRKEVKFLKLWSRLKVLVAMMPLITFTRYHRRLHACL